MTPKIEFLVQEVGRQLKQIGFTIATAESCTGGGLSFYLTSLNGSSSWFERGFVTYANAAKISMLGVSPALIAKEGAVSKAVAIAMAEGALKYSEADISIAITGIAGPEGGSKKKPVGTVWIAIAGNQYFPHTKVHVFAGDRQAIRIQSIANALEQLLSTIAQISKI